VLSCRTRACNWIPCRKGRTHIELLWEQNTAHGNWPCYCSSLLSGGGGGGVHLIFHKIFSKTEYFVEVSQRQPSLHHCVPKEICFSECLVYLFQVSGNVISSIHFSYSHIRARQIKAITSVSYFVTLIWTIFFISNFCRVLNIVCFLLGNSPASEFYMPTFRNTLSGASL
jgi:hypothetical protein